ncbi:hypothetical protein [Miltoncostaea marina]|uniref:hypothetical protein n=1 Tax=Miltoncostaea marina TaxID=2843215 RepID=UPI001C3CE6F2|nr:hypothetical protein [Miltoncostaea marina]
MDDDGAVDLESLLEATEREAADALGVVRRLQSAVAASRKAAAVGDLRALRRSLANAENALADAAEAVGRVNDSWPLSEEQEAELIASGHFTRQLIREAERAGLAMYEQEGVVSSYPVLLRTLPRQQAVSIDRKPHRQIRPSYLVGHLKALQTREPALSVERFAETLYAAYRILAPEPGVMVPLAEVHQALTLLPAAARDYGRQEFARDVYLLDRSGHDTTRSGARLRLSAGATSARDRRNLLIVVTREGVEKSYYGVEFVEAGAT